MLDRFAQNALLAIADTRRPGYVPRPSSHLVQLVAVSFAALMLTLAGSASRVYAGIIIQPTGASTDMGTSGGSINNIFNQSGLSAGYTGLVTNFDTYLASNPTSTGAASGNFWRSNASQVTGNIDLDLGGQYTIDALALWTAGSIANSAGIREFALFGASNSSFTDSILLGNFTAARGSTASLVGAQTFTFSPNSVSFVRMTVSSHYGSGSGIVINELAFRQGVTAVPEPSSLVTLLATGVIGLITRRRRRK